MTVGDALLERLGVLRSGREESRTETKRVASDPERKSNKAV
jgi:hypothetical protein